MAKQSFYAWIFLFWNIFYVSPEPVTTDRPIGVPDRPTNLAFSNVTSSSVTLTWTSGYDGGAQQQFMIWQDMVVGYMGISEPIYDNSSNHGVGNKFTYVLQHLGETSWYNLTVGATNFHGGSYVFANFVNFWTTGPPTKPTNLAISDIGNDSAQLHWTSGYDGGSQQHFIVFRRLSTSDWVQFSDFIYDETPDHGLNDNFTYLAKHLDPSKHYVLKVAADNNESRPQMSESMVDFWTIGPPQKPTNLWFSALSSNSVIIHWSSGYDGGSQQEFMVMKWLEEPNVNIQFSNNILDDSPDHGVEDQFCLKLTVLHPNTYYRLSVASRNSRDAVMSESYVEFTTLGPGSKLSGQVKTNVIIGSTVGGVVLVLFLLFMVYMLRYRGKRTSYSNMEGENRGSTKINRTLPLESSEQKHVQKIPL